MKKIAVLLMVLAATMVIFAQQQNDPALNAKAVTDQFAAIYQNLSTLLLQVSADHTLLGIVNTNAAATQAQLTSVAANQVTDEATINTHSATIAAQGTQISALQASIAAIPAFPKQIVYQSFLAQTAAVASTPLVTASATAAYTLTLIVACTGSGQVFAHISLGSSFAANAQPTCPYASTGLTSSVSLIIPAGSVVNFSSTISGTPSYDARVSVVQLGAN